LCDEIVSLTHVVEITSINAGEIIMKKILLVTLFVAIASLLSSCATQELSTYANAKPELDLVKYFVGTTDGWGMFQKRGGEVVKRFHVVITGTECHGKLVLDERFTFDDGTKQQRVWTLVQAPDGSWKGKAGDVVGEAIGHVAGNTLHWQYVLTLPVEDKFYDMQVDDWMYLVDETSLLNRTSMKKFGIEFGQVTLFFKKRS
jgi:hypothetical protein